MVLNERGSYSTTTRRRGSPDDKTQFGNFETKVVQTGDEAAGVAFQGNWPALFHNFC
jgi:hypothetical protein